MQRCKIEHAYGLQISAARAQAAYRSMAMHRDSRQGGPEDLESLSPAEQKYRASLFCRPGSAGLLQRVFFYGYHLSLRSILAIGKGDLRSLALCLALLFALLSGTVFLLAYEPYTYYHLFYGQGYERPSELYGLDEDGKAVLIAEFYRQARRPIQLEKTFADKSAMESKVVRTFLASEDARFFYHPGIDPFAILRAFWVNVFAGKIKEGASTINQQVARLRFLSQERSLMRKLKEAVLALLLELRYSKQEIIEDYLNMVPLGHGTNGVEAGARFYFHKSIQELSWGETAILASLTTRPREFSPLLHRDHSLEKVKITLQKLVERGELSAKQASAELEQLKSKYYAILNRSPNDSAFRQRLNLFPYVSAFVRNQLPKPFRSEDLLSSQGFRIYTSIRIKHQKAAQKHFIPYLKAASRARRKKPFQNYEDFEANFGVMYAMQQSLFDAPSLKVKVSRAQRKLLHAFNHEKELAFLNGISAGGNVSQALEHHLMFHKQDSFQDSVEGALLSMESRSGAITAVVGGSGFSPRNQQLRFHKIRRQPGSAFKAIIVAAALEHSAREAEKQQQDSSHNPVTAATVFDDSPLHFINRDLSEYSPENYAGSYEGRISLRRAFVLSKNSVAIQLYRKVGAANINPIAEELLGLDDLQRLPREATLALGSYGLSPLQIAAAYAVFASGGHAVRPYLIKRITDAEGRELYVHEEARKKAKPHRILSKATASLMLSLLQDVVAKGTGRAARLPGRKAAGKTGTTNRNTDAWFVGFTPKLVSAVYLGYDIPRSLGRGSTGGRLAAPVWASYMNEALAGALPAEYHFGYEDLRSAAICEFTGLLPDKDCPSIKREVFIPGTAPTKLESVQKIKRHLEALGEPLPHDQDKEQASPEKQNFPSETKEFYENDFELD